MKTHSPQYYSLFAFGLLMMEAVGVTILWIRHEQRQHALAQPMQLRIQQRQKAKQAQTARTVARNPLQAPTKIGDSLSHRETLSSKLSEAAAKGQIDRVNQLIRQGANVNDYDVESECHYPLLCAIEAHQVKMVHLLLEHGAQCNISIRSTTPLISAASQGDNAIVKQLLAHGADVDDSVKLGSALVFAAEEGHLAVVRTLVKAGAEINRCYYEDSVLYDAVGGGNTAVVAYLLAHGADVNITNTGKCTHDMTPLTHAAEDGDCAMLRLLLRYGADVDHCSKFDGSALAIAVAHGHRNAVALLLRYGAKVKVVGSLEEYHRSKGYTEEWYEERRVYDARTYTKDPKMLRMLNQYRHRLRR